MQPYYSDRNAQIVIFNARWEEVWAHLQSSSGLKHEDVALVWADPPYGVQAVQKRHGRRAGGGASNRGTSAREWAPVAGDDVPFDPRLLLAFERVVLWGANHYASRLPNSAAWWFWHKRPDMDEGVDFADGEAAWTNLGGQFRYIPIPWMGVVRPSENGERMLHPTQKPVALASWGFQRAKLKPGDLVFSPYMGSGPEARAALDMGLRFIGCEIVEEYCRAAVNRLKQLPLL